MKCYKEVSASLNWNLDPLSSNLKKFSYFDGNCIKIDSILLGLIKPSMPACVLRCSSHVRLFATLWAVGCGLRAAGLLCPWDLPGKNTWVGCRAFLQGIFPMQKSNPHLLCLLDCRQVLYPPSHLGSPNQVYWTSFNVFLTALSRHVNIIFSTEQ